MKAGWLIEAVLSLMVLGCSAVRPYPAVATPKMEEAWKERGMQDPLYRHVFWGVSQVRHGEFCDYFVISDIRPVVGPALNEFELPLLGFGFNRSCVPFDLPIRWVAGRRYMVFCGSSPAKWVPGVSEMLLERCILGIIDLDETEGEATIRASLRATPGSGVLPPLDLERVDRSALKEWLEVVRKRTADGRVSVADVVAVMGEPHQIDETWAQPGFSGVRRLGYVLKTKKLTRVEVVETVTTYEHMRLIFAFRANTLHGSSLEPYVIKVIPKSVIW